MKNQREKAKWPPFTPQIKNKKEFNKKNLSRNDTFFKYI